VSDSAPSAREAPSAAAPAMPSAPDASSAASSVAAPAAAATRDAPSAVPSRAPAFSVRAATRADTTAVAGAVHQLLRELGGTPPPLIEMEKTVRELGGDTGTGALLVAEADGEIVGVLAASWQTAIHVPGAYALIQDLWVRRSHRGQAIGHDLLAALCVLVRERGMKRVEVGLPRESFPGMRATEAFYLHNGFAPLGARMRWLLP
jgi:GNAT superfamily N-acetyltransferase